MPPCKPVDDLTSPDMNPQPPLDSRWPADVGIVALELYIPNYFVDQSELEAHDGVSSGKYTIGLGQKQMGFVDDNEDVNSLCLTAVSRLFSRQGFKPSDFGRVEVGTESILDRSKGVKTVLMQLFDDDSGDVEGIDNVTACYGGTAALFNAVNWVESSSWDGRLALVVAGDIAVYAEGNARCTGGAGAVAIVVGPNAALVFDRGLRGTHMRHVYDFYKPQLHSEYPMVDGPLSVECYLSALDRCFERYSNKFRRRISPPQSAPISLQMFDALLFHTPFCKIVQKSLGRLVLSEYLSNPDDPSFAQLKQFGDVKLETSYHNRDLEKTLIEVSKNLFNSKTLPSLHIAQRVGNMYTPSLYSCLVSYLLSKQSSSDLLSKRIAMFSYGSGMAATMFSLSITGDPGRLERLRSGISTVPAVLDNRIKLPPEEYVKMMRHREKIHNLNDFVPTSGSRNLQDETYYLSKIDEKFRRTYQLYKGPAPSQPDVSSTHITSD